MADEWWERYERKRRTHCRICGRHVRDAWVLYEVTNFGRQSVWARCVVQEECWAVRDEAERKRKRRQQRPDDLGLKPLHEAVRGECRWCGEAIYRVNKDGQVVVDRRRMWHEGRDVHPDAQPEPECVQEYNAQKFTFRDAVGAKDAYVCQDCGLDLAAEGAAWDLEHDAFRAWSDALHSHERDAEHDAWQAEYEATGKFPAYDGKRVRAWDRWQERNADWIRRNGHRPAWHADHVIPLEDGGLHEVSNGQVLCPGCHSRKTARENAERAARRRGDSQSNQLEMDAA